MSKVKLGDVAELITKGTTPTTVGGSFTSSGINFVKSESIEDSKYLNADIFEKIDADTDKKLRRSRLKKDDLLFSIAGAYLGKVAIVRGSDVPANTNQAVGIVRLKSDIVDKDYAYYFFSQKHITAYINKLSSQSSQPNLNLDLLGRLPFDLKVLAQQKKIAAALSALDAKIECNNRINAELEAMAKTLYDYWFVQFDFPDANGKPYKSSGGKMVYNPTLKRKIPAGWEDGSLWDIARYFNGLAMQKFRPAGKEYLPVIKIKEMSEGISEQTERASLDITEDAIVNDGDVLFSWSATLDVKIWSQGRGALNQHIFKVTSEVYPKSYYYFELLNYLKHFKMMAEKRKTTMGHITQDHLKQAKICIPPTKLLWDAHKKIEPIFSKHLLHEKENQHLTQLRDWLLPMLMNGQVTVK